MYEPFYRQEKINSFDISKIVSFIEEIKNDISKNGLYDIVILDSVLNLHFFYDKIFKALKLKMYLSDILQSYATRQF